MHGDKTIREEIRLDEAPGPYGQKLSDTNADTRSDLFAVAKLLVAIDTPRIQGFINCRSNRSGLPIDDIIYLRVIFLIVN